MPLVNDREVGAVRQLGWGRKYEKGLLALGIPFVDRGSYNTSDQSFASKCNAICAGEGGTAVRLSARTWIRFLWKEMLPALARRSLKRITEQARRA